MYIEASSISSSEGGRIEDKAEAGDIVVFGASGDLSHRKIMPALFHLFSQGELKEGSRIIGYARREYSRDDFINSVYNGVKEYSATFSEDKWKGFAGLLDYYCGGYDSIESFSGLKEFISTGDCAKQRIFYLATPPAVFRPVIDSLHSVGLFSNDVSGECPRVIIEKPFGVDLSSAIELNEFLHSRLDEEQIYRIDHYLGKNTVQNLLFFRFANAIFEPLWNRHQISHVTITSTESIGVEGRGGFYESAGVIRDFIQNHLLQLLSLIAMEQPARFSAEEIRNEKVKVLRSLRALGDEDYPVVLGQYEGYRQSRGVSEDSVTPTFAAMRVMIDNWRWQGVPFYIIAGKALKSRKTECCIHFKRVPTCIFGDDNACANLKPNTLTFGIQPEEEIKLEFVCKSPGDRVEASPVIMDFNYEKSFERKPLTAYERLLLDAMKGDATLFAREDETEAAWRYITPLLDEISGVEPVSYSIGSDGPEVKGLFNHLY